MAADHPISDDYDISSDISKINRLTILFIGAYDIPASDFLSNSEPFLRAFITDSGRLEDGKYARVGDMVQTPRRSYSKSIVWNTFRTFRCQLPSKSVLNVELFDCDIVESTEPIGTLAISIDDFLNNEEIKPFKFECKKASSSKKYPKFSLLLRRAFVDKPPPLQKTFFLLRHGESKWNNAQKTGSISGLLNVDHGLTTAGLCQSSALQEEWSRFRDEISDEYSASRDIKSTSAGDIDIVELGKILGSASGNQGGLSYPQSLASSPGAFPMLHLNLQAINMNQSTRIQDTSPPVNIDASEGFYFRTVRSRSNSDSGHVPPRVGDSPRSSRAPSDVGGPNSQPLSARSRSDSEDNDVSGPPVRTRTRSNSFNKHGGQSAGLDNHSSLATLEELPSPQEIEDLSIDALGRHLQDELRQEQSQCGLWCDIRSAINVAQDNTSPSASSSGTGSRVAQEFPFMMSVTNSEAGTPLSRSRSQSNATSNVMDTTDARSIADPGSAKVLKSSGVFGIAIQQPSDATQLSHIESVLVDVPSAASSYNTTNIPFPVSVVSSSPSHKDYVGRTKQNASADARLVSVSVSTSLRDGLAENESIANSELAVTTSASTLTSGCAAEGTEECEAAIASICPLTSRSADAYDEDDDNDNGAEDDDEDYECEGDTFSMLTANDRMGSFSELRARMLELRKFFLLSSRVYSSPLTRAIETAFVAMRNHPAVEKNGITLLSHIRELKGVGGFDSVGTAIGAGIFDRVASELESKLSKEECSKYLRNVQLHSNDAGSQWWTSMSSFDSKVESKARIFEFLTFVQHCGDDYPIFVGHSLFFKHFYSRAVSRGLIARRPGLAADLKRFKLANATVLAVTIQFHEDPLKRPLILDAELVFGNGFHETEKEKDQLPRQISLEGSEDRDSEFFVGSAGVQPTISSLGRLAAATTRGISAKITGQFDKINQNMASRVGSIFGLTRTES